MNWPVLRSEEEEEEDELLVGSSIFTSPGNPKCWFARAALPGAELAGFAVF